MRWPFLALTLIASASQPRSQSGPASREATSLRRCLRYSGRVVDPEGTPLAGAGIAAVDRDRLTVRDALERPLVRTDKDGCFLVERWIEPDESELMVGFLIARADRAAWSWWSHGYSAPLPGRAHGDEAIDIGDVRLPEGVDLRGRVRAPDGRGLAGARVEAIDLVTGSSSNHQRFFRTCAVTASDGGFVLPCALRQGSRLVVAADGFYRRTLAPVAAGEPLDVQLAQSGFVTGRVLDAEGRPGAARVVLESEAEPLEWAWRSQDTAADGSFRLPVFYPGRLRVLARARTPGTHFDLKGDVLPGAAEGVELRMAAGVGSTLSVQAVDAASGAPVRAFWAATVMPGTEDPAALAGVLGGQGTVASGQDGLARVPLRAAANSGVAVGVLAPDFVPGFAPAGAATKDAPSTVTVRLARGATLEGRVTTDPPDAVRGGVSIRCWPLGADGKPAMQYWSSGHRHGGMATRTAADGRFRLTGMWPGRYEITAVDASQAASPPLQVEIAEPAETVAVELAAPRPAAFAGRLVGGSAPMPWKLRLEREVPKGGYGLFPFEDDPRLGTGVLLGTGGTFALTAMAEDARFLVLQVPVSSRSGPALRIPLGDVAKLGLPALRELDIAGQFPGRIAGRVELTGVPMPLHRLVVVAREAPGRVPEFDLARNSGVFAQHVFPAGDGRFGMLLTRGTYWLALQDVVTGVILAWHPDAVDLRPGETSEVTVRGEIAAVRAELVPEKDRTWCAFRMKIDTEAESDAKNPKVHSSPVWSSGAGLDLGEHPSEVSFFVGPGSTRMRVFAYAVRLFPGLKDWQAPLAEVECTATAGEHSRVRLVIPPPPER